MSRIYSQNLRSRRKREFAECEVLHNEIIETSGANAVKIVLMVRQEEESWDPEDKKGLIGKAATLSPPAASHPETESSLNVRPDFLLCFC